MVKESSTCQKQFPIRCTLAQLIKSNFSPLGLGISPLVVLDLLEIFDMPRVPIESQTPPGTPCHPCPLCHDSSPYASAASLHSHPIPLLPNLFPIPLCQPWILTIPFLPAHETTIKHINLLLFALFIVILPLLILILSFSLTI
jgi:hypothetical protein